MTSSHLFNLYIVIYRRNFTQFLQQIHPPNTVPLTTAWAVDARANLPNASTDLTLTHPM
ncbi:hypothetical protein MKI79_00585 [Acinetobacter sp. A3.8]|uniref:Uncharacterized protein n=1 Tax=Acinetobacter sedimenti TaxID=2919922 RepID=A0A9X1WVL4_9GAMM|nr:hypothetical protein [Acinetobacter sedimenti]MCJ8145428.1 hypothetical protein [Acinetobacter sedimenti]